jgi:energy-coupling factor transporter ATP-binding protein EcfA2
MIHDYLGETYISLIDFGSAKRRTPTKKTRDDLRNLASHIARIMNILDLDPQPTTRYEDAALTACRSLHAVMSDDDPLRQRESAGVLLQDINKYYPRGSFEQHLTRPFDFGNAEEVMDNKLLHQLASTSFPWKDKIESSSHMLIVGPRGCGKTTVFRSLSFNCLADADQMGEALSRPYVGLYISCNKEFRLRFSALAPEVLKHREEDLRHYFNLLVLREFAAVMIACHEKSQLGHQDVQQFAEFCREACGLATKPASPPRTLLRSIESRVTQAIGKARMHIWGNEPCDNRTQQDLVARLARFMGEMAGPLHGKLLYLFVDDYTERKVPQEAQRALNHILFVPNALYRSKISSEVFGVAPDQTFGDFLVQDRDYKEWNLGTLYYLDLPSDGKKQFLRDIVNTRLRLCEYKGTVDDVIGASEYPDGSLARALRLDAGGEVAATKTQKAYYHGWDTICDLCTGDISNILEILDRIYGECAVRKSSKSKVDQERQHQAIEGYSLQYTAKIKGIPKYGEKLFEIVDAFGNMCKRLLREHPVIDRGDGRQDPYQLLRIELDEGFVRSSAHVLQVESQGIAEREASDRPAILWMLLQRYCIFIDAEPSRSRRNTLASKVIMRRIFCPAFKTGLVNSESYTLDKKHWEAFCADPKGESERYARTANDHPLFGDEQEG